MDKLFVIIVFVVAILSIINNPFSQQKLPRSIKIILFIVIIACLGFQSWYVLKEKEAADDKAYNNELFQDKSLSDHEDFSKDFNEFKELNERKKQGLLTNDDYIKYIVLYLESIDRTLKYRNNKNVRSWITAYYEEVEKIPGFYNYQEWLIRESSISRSVKGAINSDFNARGLYNSGMRTAVIEAFTKEREALLNAKKREVREAGTFEPSQ